MAIRSFGRLALLCAATICIVGAGPAASAPPLATYGSLPGFERAAISPSGERVALIGIVDGKRTLLVVDKANKPLLVRAIDNQKIRGLSWAGEDRVLVEISQTSSLGVGFVQDKAELVGMVVVPIDATPMWSIFDKSKDVTGGIRHFYGTVERAGKYYGYFGGITLKGDGKGAPYLATTQPDLYEVDLQTGKYVRIAAHADSNELFRTWLVDSTGKVAATFDYVYRSGDWRIKNADANVIASGSNPRGNVGMQGFGRAADTLIYEMQDEADGAQHWFEVALKDGNATEILKAEQINQIYISNRDRTLTGYQQDADVPIPRFFDARKQKIMDATRRAFPGLTVNMMDSNDSFDKLIVETEGVGDPQTWWLVDIATGQATDLGSSYPMHSADVAPMQMIHYKAADGLDIAGVLTIPPGRQPKNLPVVVLPHGRSRDQNFPLKNRDYPRFDWWAQALASRGYAVFQPNFRGSSGYGSAFETAGHGEWGGKMLSDISDGLAALAKQGIVDAKRACIMGTDYGGYAALAGTTLQHGLYRCAVAVAGVSDVEQMYLTNLNNRGQNQMVLRSLKAEIGSGRDLKLISPVRYAAQADAPILLIHGKNDTVVMYDQSVAMEHALRGAGKPVEFVTLPGEDHWLSQSVTRLAMLQAAIDFVEHYNPPDPAK